VQQSDAHPTHRLAAFIVRWRVLVYLLLLIGAIALARAGIEARRHAPPPPNVESDD